MKTKKAKPLKLSRKLKKAIKEADDILKGKTYAKGYRNMDELEKDLLK